MSKNHSTVTIPLSEYRELTESFNRDYVRILEGPAGRRYTYIYAKLPSDINEALNSLESKLRDEHKSHLNEVIGYWKNEVKELTLSVNPIDKIPKWIRKIFGA